MMPSSTDSRRRRIAQGASDGRRNNGSFEQAGYTSTPYNSVAGSSYNRQTAADYTPSASSTMDGRSSTHGGNGGHRRDMRSSPDGLQDSDSDTDDEGSVPGLFSGSSGRFWGGPTNSELTTSYMDYRYDGGVMGDLYTVLDRPAPQSMPRTPRYEERDLGYSTRAPEYRLPSMPRDDCRRDSLIRDVRIEQNGRATTSELSAEMLARRRQAAASQYPASLESHETSYPCQTRREFQGETYINGNIESRYGRAQPDRRRRRDFSDVM